MRQLYVEVIISLSIGSIHIGDKKVDSYFPVLKEDLQSFMRKMEIVRKEAIADNPSSLELKEGTISLNLLTVKFNKEYLEKESDLFKTVQAMIFEL